METRRLKTMLRSSRLLFPAAWSLALGPAAVAAAVEPDATAEGVAGAAVVPRSTFTFVWVVG